jgi:hypothetical protein
MFFGKEIYVTKKKDSANSCILPKHIVMNNGTQFISFTRIYLDSYLTLELSDNKDVSERISKASQQMGMLRHVWNAPELCRRVKFWTFITGPVNTLL